MKAVSAQAVRRAVVVLGVLGVLLPPGTWQALGAALSPDGDLGDPGVAHLVGQTGRVMAGLCGLGLLGWWRRGWLRAVAGWVATCSLRQWLLLLGVAVVGPRAGWMLITHTTPFVDLAWYHEHAQHLAAGGGYLENGRPTAFWPIGYPAFLAVLYRLVGPSLAAAKTAQVCLAWITGVLLWRTGRRLLPEGGARLAALLYALCPSAVMFTELLSTETLFATLLVGTWAALAAAPEGASPEWRRSAGLGVLAGLGMLVKPVLLPWPGLALLLLRGRAGIGRAVRDAAIVYGAALLVVAPWTLRNYRAFGRFVLVSTNAGFNLYVGNGPGATGAVRVLPEAEWAPYYAMANEAERDAALRDAALRAMAARPGRVLALVPAKLAALLRDDSAALRWAGSAPGADWSPGRALVTRLLLDGSYYACGLLGAVWALRRGWRVAAVPRLWLAVWSWAAYLGVVHAVYYGDPRYHVALWPLLALAAAGGVVVRWSAAAGGGAASVPR